MISSPRAKAALAFAFSIVVAGCVGQEPAIPGTPDDAAVGGETSIPRDATTTEGDGGGLGVLDGTAVGDAAPADATVEVDTMPMDGNPPMDSSGGDADAGVDADAGGCVAPELSCGGACVASDVHNCGTCGHDCTNLPNVTGAVWCTNGTCGFTASACKAGYAHCGGSTDLGCETSIASQTHCGACGTGCSGGTPLYAGSGASFACVSGCPSGTPTLCGGGTCTDTTSDANNCGGCGTTSSAYVCAGGTTCQSGHCICPTGTHACVGVCDSDTSVSSCGPSSCAACPAPTNGVATCDGTSCGMSCPSGTLCGTACVDTTSDTNNCGQCGTNCPGPTWGSGNGKCSGSACTITCPISPPCGTMCIVCAGNGICNAGCSGQQPQSCTTGQWQNSGAACSGATPACTLSGCVAGPPSCQPGGSGMTNCGAGAESCCASLEVWQGNFDRTYTNSGTGPAGATDPANVSALRLDKYAVTVGRFRQFMNAVLPPGGGAGWRAPDGSGKHSHLNGGQGLANSASSGTYEPGFAAQDNANVASSTSLLACDPTLATWTNSPATHENLPINCVNWFDAYAFCIWDGGFLPSEAEWEFAAAAGSLQRAYPWGSTDPGSANQYAIHTCYYPLRDASAGCNIAPVGTPPLGAGFWGQLDLAGNMNQWVLDAYAAYVAPCNDCADMASAPDASTIPRVYRGGDFREMADQTQPWNRYVDTSTNRTIDVGFRCARTP